MQNILKFYFHEIYWLFIYNRREQMKNDTFKRQTYSWSVAFGQLRASTNLLGWHSENRGIEAFWIKFHKNSDHLNVKLRPKRRNSINIEIQEIDGSSRDILVKNNITRVSWSQDYSMFVVMRKGTIKTRSVCNISLWKISRQFCPLNT